MAGERIHLSVEAARALGEAALRGIGYDAEEAWIITDHVIDAALCGYEYSGLAKLLNLVESARFPLPRQPMRVLRETPVSVLYDAGNNNGMLALYHATKGAIAKAASLGIAVVGVTNTWMSGRGAYFAEMIARADLVGIHTAAASRLVAPLGGIKPALGTNPMAFGLPGGRGPVIFDMGTSAFMFTELQLRERLGQQLPENVAVGGDGRPTRDPSEARRGALLPFAGYKGFGLGLIVQALGVLADSARDLEHDNGCLFIVMKPDLLVPLDQFKRELDALVDRVKATPRQVGVAEIRIPSERAFRHREQALKEGLTIDRAVQDALTVLARRSGPAQRG